MLNLDYSIITAKERCEAVKQLDLSTVPTRDLEKAANYILFGKAENGKSFYLAKQIDTKKSTYRKKQNSSLEELMEKPTFDERNLKHDIKRSVYTNPKPTISRKRDADIPNMKQLWEAIEKTETLYEKTEDGIKKYILKHVIIELRKEQYYLKDLFKPTIKFLNPIKTPPHNINWFADTGYAKDPLRTSLNRQYTGNDDWEWVTVSENTLDFTNSNHIYHLLNNYSALKQQFFEQPHAQMNVVLILLEKIIDETPLTRPHKYILIRKVDHAFNEEISQEVYEKFKVKYGPNYISTIWKQNICGKIAKTAKNIENWTPAQNDKRCSCCKIKKPRKLEFFKPDSKKPDGLNSECLVCFERKKI